MQQKNTNIRISRRAAGAKWRSTPSRLGSKILAVAACMGLTFSIAEANTLIDLDATSQPLGQLDPWPNSGTISGDFNAASTIFAYAPGQVITVDGVKGVAIPTSDSGTTGTAYEGPVVPESICGDASRTIEAWVWDPQGQAEKTIFAWGHRDGPDGSNCTFGHGNNETWGTLGGWGFADIGYGANFVTQRWTYVVYTYDAATKTAKTYVDGALPSQKHTRHHSSHIRTMPMTSKFRSGSRGKRMQVVRQ